MYMVGGGSTSLWVNVQLFVGKRRTKLAFIKNIENEESPRVRFYTYKIFYHLFPPPPPPPINKVHWRILSRLKLF